MSGIVSPDAGEIILDRLAYRPRNILDAKAAGLSTAFQELSLIPTLSVTVNLFLPKPKVNALRLVSMRSLEEDASAILNQYGITGVSPSAWIGDLPLAARQRIEIARAMLRKPGFLLLDEPTAALSEREWLFGLIDVLIARGTSILYVTHRLDEVRRLCKRCVILRNGKKVLDASTVGMTDEDVFSKMAGRSVGERYPVRESRINDSAPPPFGVWPPSSGPANVISVAVPPG